MRFHRCSPRVVSSTQILSFFALYCTEPVLLITTVPFLSHNWLFRTWKTELENLYKLMQVSNKTAIFENARTKLAFPTHTLKLLTFFSVVLFCSFLCIYDWCNIFKVEFLLFPIQFLSATLTKVTFQDFSEKTNQIIILASIIAVLLLVFIACQFPTLLRSEMFSTGVSLLVVSILGFGGIYLNGSSAPLPLFSLLLAVHTMLPVHRLISLTLALIFTCLALLYLYVSRSNQGLHVHVSFHFLFPFRSCTLFSSYLMRHSRQILFLQVRILFH